MEFSRNKFHRPAPYPEFPGRVRFIRNENRPFRFTGGAGKNPPEYRCHAITTRQNRGLDVTHFVTFLAKNAG
jgi:hypothetical protein